MMISEENWVMERFMGNFGGKLKRKESEDIDQVSYEFSDFSLSSPPNKIRRLDAELPPIIEEEEELTPESPIDAPTSSSGDGLVIEELNDSDFNKAIVVFKPFSPAMLGSCYNTNVSFSIDSHFISGFKDKFIQSSLHGLDKEDEAEAEAEAAAAAFGVSNQCKAVVPWAPSQSLSVSQAAPSQSPSVSQSEDDITEGKEESNGVNTLRTQPPISAYGSGMSVPPSVAAAAKSLPQWPQQHCMFAQPQHNTSSIPFSWFQ